MRKFRPKWISPGIVFLSFLAKPIHLQLLSEEDYKKLIKEMPAALDVLYGNIKGKICTYSIKRILLFFPETKKIMIITIELKVSVSRRYIGICLLLSTIRI